MLTATVKRITYFISFILVLVACNQESAIEVTPELGSQSPQAIDATPLGAARFNVLYDTGHVVSNFRNDGLKDLNLSTGDYAVCAPYSLNCLAFSVDTNNHFQYDTSLDTCFDGAGTSALTVTGFDIALDTSALSHARFNLTGPGKSHSIIGYNNSGVQTANLLPGDYLFCAPYHTNGLAFTVDTSGLLRFDPSPGTFLSGAGTTTLTMTGFDFTLDTTALSHTRYNIMNGTQTTVPVRFANSIKRS